MAIEMDDNRTRMKEERKEKKDLIKINILILLYLILYKLIIYINKKKDLEGGLGLQKYL